MPGLPGSQGGNRRGTQQGCDLTISPIPQSLRYLRPPRGPRAERSRRGPPTALVAAGGQPREPGAPGSPGPATAEEGQTTGPRAWRAVQVRAAKWPGAARSQAALVGFSPQRPEPAEGGAQRTPAAASRLSISLSLRKQKEPAGLRGSPSPRWESVLPPNRLALGARGGGGAGRVRACPERNRPRHASQGRTTARAPALGLGKHLRVPSEPGYPAARVLGAPGCGVGKGDRDSAPCLRRKTVVPNVLAPSAVLQCPDTLGSDSVRVTRL